MEFMLGGLGTSFALYAGGAGMLAALAAARRIAGPAQATPPLEALWAPLGLASLATAFASGAGPDIRLAAGALLLTGLILLTAAPHRLDWTTPGRRLGQALIVLSIAVALAGAFLSSPDAPNSGP